MSKLIEEAHDKTVCKSLAVFKPLEISGFTVEEVGREWDKKKIEKLMANHNQSALFGQNEDPFDVVNKLPYKFRYVVKDCNGKESRMMIEDWEIGQLYWNSLRNNDGDENKAILDVKKKYFENFAKKKDLYLYLGTTQLHHYTSRNPFTIIGVFYPPIEPQANQKSLF